VFTLAHKVIVGLHKLINKALTPLSR